MPTNCAKPLYATSRNTALLSEGEQVGIVARALGTPLIPWQQLVADVAGERRPDGSYEYQVVVVTVPRQCGKTTLLRAVGTQRCLVNGRDFFYTAQTGKDARERWYDLVKILRTNEAFKGRVKESLRGGSEQVTFPGGGSFRVFAPTVESLHGYTPPTVCIDEAFSLSGMAGELLMGAIGPAQFTIMDRQIWIVSTAGTAESAFLHDWIDRGMEGAPRVACFAWGATDDQDPFDLADIAAFHPGVGNRLNGKLLTAADVLAEADRNSRAEYERAFANRRTVTLSHLVPAEAWRALAPRDDAGRPVLEPPAADQRPVLAYDVSHDRQAGSIVASWMTPAGVPAVKVVRAQPGTGWMVAALADLAAKLNPAAIVVAGNGPVLEVSQHVQRHGKLQHRLRVLTEREFATACGGFLTAIDEAALAHDDDDHLLRSVVGLVTRPAMSDGVAFSRRHSVGDSSAAIGATLASWLLQHKPAAVQPAVYFGKDSA